jgi:hypothetical protein
VTAFASGRICSDSVSLFMIEDPAAKHSAPNHNCPAKLSVIISSVENQNVDNDQKLFISVSFGNDQTTLNAFLYLGIVSIEESCFRFIILMKLTIGFIKSRE